MESETFQKAVEKATFDLSITEIVIKSNGTTACIDTVGAANDRLAHVEFPFDVEGEWGIINPQKLIKSLKNITGKANFAKVNIMQKDDMLFISGHGKKYKFPVVDDISNIKNRSKITPTREGCDIFFNSKLATTLPAIFTPSDISGFKKIIASEKLYKENTTMTFKKSMNLYGEDVTDFAVGDVIEGEFVVPFSDKISSKYNGLHEVGKILGTENVTICMGQGDMLYIDDIDGDVSATFVIMGLIEE